MGTFVEEYLKWKKKVKHKNGNEVRAFLYLPFVGVEPFIHTDPFNGKTLDNIIIASGKIIKDRKNCRKILSNIPNVQLYETPNVITRALLARRVGAPNQWLLDVLLFAKQYDIEPTISELSIILNEVKLYFKSYRPATESPLSDEARKKDSSLHAPRILQLREIHDPANLEKLQKQIKGSRLRVCELKPKTHTEGNCLMW